MEISAIGAPSGGGAFRRLLDATPSFTAFILVQHFNPEHDSLPFGHAEALGLGETGFEVL